MKRFYVLIISFLLVFLLILWIGPGNIFNAFKTADRKLILFAIFIHLLAVGVRSLRWGIIIKKPLELKKNYVVTTIGIFAGNFSPMRTAGEPLKAIVGKRINEISLSEGLSAGLTERFFDLAIVSLLLILSCIWMPKVLYLSILGAIISLGVVALIYFLNWREDTSIWLYKKIHPLIEKLPIGEDVLDKLYAKSIDGLKSMVKYTHSFTTSKNLIFVFILSFTSWILECFRLLIVFYAFDIKISLISIIIIFLLANIIGVLSALPGGIGSIEISLTGLFVLFGIPATIGGSIALIDRLVSFWVVSALGIIFSFYYAKDILEEIKKYTIDFRVSKK